MVVIDPNIPIGSAFGSGMAVSTGLLIITNYTGLRYLSAGSILKTFVVSGIGLGATIYAADGIRYGLEHVVGPRPAMMCLGILLTFGTMIWSGVTDEYIKRRKQ